MAAAMAVSGTNKRARNLDGRPSSSHLSRQLTRARTRRIAPQLKHSSEDDEHNSTPGLTSLVDTAKVTFAEEELEGKLPCIIHPHNPFMGYWDGITGVALIFTAFVTPFEVGFLPPPKSLTDPLFIINRLLDVIFCLDMVFSSLLMYSIKGGTNGGKGKKDNLQRSVDAWEFRLSPVCGHYLRGWFIIDVLSVAPSAFDILPLVQGDSDDGGMENFKVMRNIRTLRLIKLLRIVRGSRVLKRWETRISMPYATITLTQLMLMVVYAVHIVACVLGIISDFSTPKPKLDSWQGYFGWCGAGEEVPDGYTYAVLLYDETTDEPFTCVQPIHMWLQCIGWALILVVAGGGTPEHGPYPDNAEEEPLTFLNHETVSLVVLVLCGAGMWAYVTARFVEVIANSNPDQAHFRNQIDDLNRFASFHSLPEEMRRRLRAYQFERYQVQLAEARKRVFGHFSEELQEEVAWEINGQWLLRIPVFRSLPRPFLIQVSLNLSSTVYAPKEKPPAQRIYVIFQGCCTYKGQTLTVGETWGQADMAKTSRPVRAIATTYLHVNYVATRTIFELAEKDGTAATLWSIKKWVLFQSIRSYLLDNLRRERKRKVREEVGKRVDDDDDGMRLVNIVAPVSVERRVESLGEEVAEVRRDMQLIKAALGVGSTTPSTRAPLPAQVAPAAMAPEAPRPLAAPSASAQQLLQPTLPPQPTLVSHPCVSCSTFVPSAAPPPPPPAVRPLQHPSALPPLGAQPAARPVPIPLPLPLPLPLPPRPTMPVQGSTVRWAPNRPAN